MKRFNWLMMLMAAFTMSLAACEKDAPAPGPGPDPDPDPTPETEMTFAMEVLNVTRSSVQFNLTPSSLEDDYVVFVYPSMYVESCATDAEIVEKIYSEINKTATEEESFADIMAEVVKTGEIKDGEITGLNADFSYYLLAFAVDAENNYAACSKVTKAKFKTQAKPVSTCTFEVKANTVNNGAALAVTPSDDNQTWHIMVVDVETYNSYTSEEGEYGWSIDEFYNNFLQTNKESYTSAEDFLRKEVFTGKRTVSASGLKPKTKYTSLVAGVAVEGDAVVPCTSVHEVRFNAGEAAANDLTFDVEVFNIESYSAEIRITPSDLNAEYYYYISYIDTKTKGAKPIDVANHAVTEYIYYWGDNNQLMHQEPVKGVVDLTGDNKVELNIAETEYYVVVFSYDLNETYGTVIDEETGEYDANPGTVTSAPVFVSFMTSKQGDPMNAEFEFRASDVGPYDFYLEIDASDPTIYYQPGIAYANNFDPQSAIAASASTLSQLMQMCMEGQNPCLTYQEALEKCSHMYRNGDGKYYVANLYPNTEYIGYVLVIDAKTGTFARCVYSELLATTNSVGAATPSIELLGIYDGNEENGAVFGDADLTAGRVVVAVEHKSFDGATALYGAFTEGDISDPTADPKFSDQYIISEFKGYWDTLRLDVPYNFYVAEWDIAQSALAYALDANGHEGKVGRLAVTPKQKTGDIAELQAYVDAVAGNTVEAYKASKSMVYSVESLEPAMECVWSEKVEIAAPQVVRQVGELPVFVGDIKALTTVRSVRF